MCFNTFVEDNEIELHDLVRNMRRGLYEFYNTYMKRIGGKDKDLSFISECLKQATSVPLFAREPASFVFKQLVWVPNV